MVLKKGRDNEIGNTMEGVPKDKDTKSTIEGQPKDILQNILEHLPIRDAVRASTLLKEWRYLWLERTCIVFDKQFFESNFRDEENLPDKYVSVISKILSLHVGCIYDFDLYIPNLSHDHWDANLCHWLLLLSKKGIKKLQLVNEYVSPCMLPSCLFSCTKLIDLKLKNCVYKPPDIPFGYPSLKNLYFEEVLFICGGAFIPNAPLLENLSFNRCKGIRDFNVFALKPKILYAYENDDPKFSFLDKFQNFEKHTIALRYQSVGPGTLSYLLEKSRESSSIHVHGSLLKHPPTTGRHTLKLEILELTFICFNDLNHISYVLCLLRSSPKLKTLRISVLPSNGAAPELVLSQLEALDSVDELPKLKNMKVTSIEGSKAELLFIKRILASSPCLRSMDVACSIKDQNEQIRISTELMQFHRLSSMAKINYSTSDSS